MTDGNGTPDGKTAIEIDILVEDDGWGDGERWRQAVTRAVTRTVALAGVELPPACEVSVVLADDARVKELNRDYRGKDKPTNVLSFPGSDDLDSPLLGDVILARETVEREAIDEAKSFEHHFGHLIVHGMLHLLGFDHLTDDEAAEMEALETEILAALDIPDPYAGTVPVGAGDH